MKKIILALLLALFTLSCSDDDNSSSNNLSNTPMANATYDSNNYGIYKGVFVGSTGYVLININNDGTISAKLTIDNSTYNFTTTESVTLGQPISGLTFTNGSMTFDFNVSSNGSYPYVTNINISGHPDATIEIIKELSEHLVRCYTGTFKGDSSGIFNLIFIEDEITGLARDNEGTVIYLEGSVNNNAISGEFEGGTFAGNINNNSISGTWQNVLSENGTWSGTRRL